MKMTKKELMGLESGLKAIGQISTITVRLAYNIAKILKAVVAECDSIRTPMNDYQKANLGVMRKNPTEFNDEDLKVMEENDRIINNIDATMGDKIDITLDTLKIDDFPETGISAETLVLLDKVIK